MNLSHIFPYISPRKCWSIWPGSMMTMSTWSLGLIQQKSFPTTLDLTMHPTTWRTCSSLRFGLLVTKPRGERTPWSSRLLVVWWEPDFFSWDEVKTHTECVAWQKSTQPTFDKVIDRTMEKDTLKLPFSALRCLGDIRGWSTDLASAKVVTISFRPWNWLYNSLWEYIGSHVVWTSTAAGSTRPRMDFRVCGIG